MLTRSRILTRTVSVLSRSMTSCGTSCSGAGVSAAASSALAACPAGCRLRHGLSPRRAAGGPAPDGPQKNRGDERQAGNGAGDGKAGPDQPRLRAAGHTRSVDPRLLSRPPVRHLPFSGPPPPRARHGTNGQLFQGSLGGGRRGGSRELAGARVGCRDTAGAGPGLSMPGVSRGRPGCRSPTAMLCSAKPGIRVQGRCRRAPSGCRGWRFLPLTRRRCGDRRRPPCVASLLRPRRPARSLRGGVWQGDARRGDRQ